MSGRYRTVAFQAVGVAVLAAFVFVAFLRPTDPGKLSGIEAPGGGDGPTVVAPPDDDKDKKVRRDHKGAEHGNGESPHDGTRSGSTSAAEAGGPDNPESSSPPATGPDDDQYTDPVTVLMKQVGKPGLFREIDGR
jgi:hypothetical protein